MQAKLISAALLAALGATGAQAQSGARAAGNPCAFQTIDIDRYGKQPFRNPPEIRSRNGRIDTTLVVRYTDPATTSMAGCPLRMRSYNGALVGPTMRVRPGDVIAPLLDNQLPRESRALADSQFLQEDSSAFITMRPYTFNTTNLHTHGLHVSPSGNSDNVLLAIAPQEKLRYDIRLPGDHTRGTYWYHAHTHGSTAIQVGSAMAGALIVEDDPRTLPPALAAATAREKIMVIQTMLYDATGEANNIAAFFPDNAHTDSLCRQGNNGCTWLNSKRQVTINGQIVPVIRMQPGEVQRWRMIDGAFRETISLKLQGHALHEIATDGIYTGRIDRWSPAQPVRLYPGYRSDVLVQASMTPGTYRLVDDTTTVRNSLRGVAEDGNLLALVVVAGAPLRMQLPTQAQMAALAPFRGVDLSKTANAVQEVVFKLGSGLSPNENRNTFEVNYAPFNETRIRYLQLNDTDVWSLTTVGDPGVIPPGRRIPPLPHIFHIHINPFQVQRRGPDGRQQWVWKDTQFVPAGETVNVFTKYTDFTGKFVIHCHILDHEDLGMMEVVEVVERLPIDHPHGTGAVRASGHSHRD